MVASLLFKGEQVWNAGLPPFLPLMWLATPALCVRTRPGRFGASRTCARRFWNRLSPTIGDGW